MSDGTGRNSRHGRIKYLPSDWTTYESLSGRIEEMTPRLSHAEDLESCMKTSWPGVSRDSESFDLSWLSLAQACAASFDEAAEWKSMGVICEGRVGREVR